MNKEQLLDDWFANCREDFACSQDRMDFWFATDEDRDARLQKTYLPWIEALDGGELQAWMGSTHGRLALILLMDQLTRNLFRGTARAFAYDARACNLTLIGIQTGEDKTLTPAERMFFYMPLEHAEDIHCQNLCVASFEGLAADYPDHSTLIDSYTDYARHHREIIQRFGRFPHRNDVLGRTCTSEEQSYLDQGAPRFGQ